MYKDKIKTAESLSANSIGFWALLAMGIAGTAPAFSVETTASTLIASVGILSPASIFYCGVIMFGVVLSFINLNKINPNAGASYAWVTQVFGKTLGFMSGWALLVASCLFTVSATVPASNAILLLLFPEYVNDTNIIAIISFIIFTLVTLVIVKGIHISSKVQTIMVLLESIILGAILVTGFYLFKDHPVNFISPSSFSLMSFDIQHFVDGALVALFFYWGWDVIMNLSEESKDKNHLPGRSAFWTMLILIFIFIAFISLTLISLSTSEIEHYNTNIIYAIAEKLAGNRFALLAIIAVLLSTLGTIETQILQFSRTLFAQARDGVLHNIFASIHYKWKTPHKAILTIWIIGSGLIFASSYIESINELLSTLITSIGFQISFYLGLTSLACAYHYRKDIFNKDFVKAFSHVWLPLFSGLILAFVFFYSMYGFDLKTNILGLGGILIGLIPFYYFKERNKKYK